MANFTHEIIHRVSQVFLKLWLVLCGLDIGITLSKPD